MPGKAAVVQSAPFDPVLLLSPDNIPEPSYLSDKIIPALGGFVGIIGTTWHNYSKRRPFLSGIPFIAGFTVAGVAIGMFIQNRNDAYFAERDAVFRHYVSLHPEDFPARGAAMVMVTLWGSVGGRRGRRPS